MTRTRSEIELDLPFHVNGTLTDAERAEIDGWLADDALLAAEHAALAAIRADMQAEEIRSPGEFGLARLMRDIGRDGHAMAGPPSPSRTWMWQAAAAIAVVALLGQTLLMRTDTAEVRSAGFELAGAAVAPGALVVGFMPDASEQQIRDLLVGLNLEIVGGPSALGLYRLDAAPGGDLAEAAAALRAASAIVESVENAQE
ncbi:MAG: hypothetical protein KDJ98_05650 [Rhodobacteraceae bacterium]|nr:hypothetical protein [Paracoccaceae bacterium]